MPTPSLRVLIEGKPLPSDDAQGVWLRFSQHMDAHQGDFDGFAQQEGYRYAAVAVQDGRPTLKLSNSEPSEQTRLAPAAQGQTKGKGKSPRKGGRKRRRRRKKPPPR